MSEPAERSESEIIDRFRCGDIAAFKDLFTKYRQPVYSIAFRITGNREDALEVVQDTFFKTFRSIRRWRGEGSFYTWLYRIAVNTALDSVRQMGHRSAQEQSYPVEQTPEGELQSNYGNPADELERKEIRIAVNEALGALTKNQRTVFLLRHYEELKLGEIASILNCSLSSVRVHLTRAMEKLRKRLSVFWEIE